MIIIRYNLLDTVTQQCIPEGQPSPNGRKHPPLSGLDVKLRLGDGSFVAYVPDDSNVDTNAGILILDESALEALVTTEFNARVVLNKNSINSYADYMVSAGNTNANTVRSSKIATIDAIVFDHSNYDVSFDQLAVVSAQLLNNWY